MMGVKRGGCMFQKEGGISRRGGMKKESGGLIHLSALCVRVHIGVGEG